MRAVLLLVLVVLAWSLVLGCGETPAEQNAKTKYSGGPSGKATLLRTPHKGIQPQAAVDGKGTVHMIYFSGDPRNGDVFHVRSIDGGDTFAAPLRVNSQPGSAIAVGNIRGAHLAVGRNGRVHVAWMGSGKAEPRAPGKGSPMLYTRLDDAGRSFEPQRNLIQSAVGLDGGGSVAADNAGNVYVAWHAPAAGEKGEENRRVWVARSTDEGKTFAREEPGSETSTGVCGCCGMRAFADSKGRLHVLYRSARESVNRDTTLLTSADQGKSFKGARLQGWKINACPMSSMAFTEGDGDVLAAWETRGQVSFARLDPKTGKPSTAVAAPGHGGNRKHPVVAVNVRGEVLLAWTEGMGWNRGGSVAWQVFDRQGQPTAEKGRRAGVPVWSLVAVFARADGSFRIVY